jgi:hypothetical protein
MKIMVKDVEGGKAFIERIVAAASEIAFCFAHEPDDKVIAELERMRPALVRDLTSTLGAEAAADLADSFVKAVLGHKHHLEVKGAGSA